MKEKKKHTSVALVVIVLAVFISMCGIMFAKGKKTAGAETASAVPTGTAEEKSGRQETANTGKKVKTKKKSKNPLYTLVNKENRLPDDYTVSLVQLKTGKQVAKAMYRDLRNMWFDCEGQNPGYSITVVSGYRTYAKQGTLLDEEIRKNERLGMTAHEAKKDALRTVAPPGYSEHETGLCVDITAKNNLQLNASQGLTRENIWLRKNCTRYGFVLRYPKGKEKITGYQYESWHFRYVGKKAAAKMKKNNWTLEEYLAAS